MPNPMMKPVSLRVSCGCLNISGERGPIMPRRRKGYALLGNPPLCLLLYEIIARTGRGDLSPDLLPCRDPRVGWEAPSQSGAAGPPGHSCRAGELWRAASGPALGGAGWRRPARDLSLEPYALVGGRHKMVPYWCHLASLRHHTGTNSGRLRFAFLDGVEGSQTRLGTALGTRHRSLIPRARQGHLTNSADTLRRNTSRIRI